MDEKGRRVILRLNPPRSAVRDHSGMTLFALHQDFAKDVTSMSFGGAMAIQLWRHCGIRKKARLEFNKFGT